MKFTNLFFGVGVAIIGFTSCSKDKEVVTPAPVTPADNRVAVIKFNGNSFDSTKRINLNTVFGSPALVEDRFNNPNSALYLDGSSKLEYFDVPLKGQNFSIAAWVKFYYTGLGSQIYIHAMHPAGGGIGLGQSDDRHVSSVSVPGTSSAMGTSFDKNWHHVATTYDGKLIKLYVDGILISTKSHEGAIGDQNRTLVIGAFLGEFWKGYIDDLRLFNTTLSENEIKQVFAIK